jgi:arylformamidase
VSQTPWQAFTLTEREREYSPSSCIGGNYQPFVAAYKTRSVEALTACRAQGAVHHELRYGPKPAHRIDLWVPPKKEPGAGANSAPPGLLVFIHGGYWQELSAADSLFAASDCVSHGVVFAAIDYTLAPAASVAEIVGECRAAVALLMRQAPALGLDANRMVVAGSSAGAHLAAMVALNVATADVAHTQTAEAASTQTAGTADTPPALRAVVLVSGIYDLEPLVGTSINQALALDTHSAGKVSPLQQLASGMQRDLPPALVCWGEIETGEFKRQSAEMATLWQRFSHTGAQADTFEVARRNHFDVVLDLANPATVLGCKTLALFSP